MIIRNIAITIATIASLSPAISQASTERTSVKACASAFASSISSANASQPYKLAYRGDAGSTISDFYPIEYTFTLEAHDLKTGAAIARAVCSTNARGAVTEISAVPLASKASLAAQF